MATVEAAENFEDVSHPPPFSVSSCVDNLLIYFSDRENAEQIFNLFS